MRLLISGGAGFIGSHIAEEALKEGYEVFIVDDLSAGIPENIPPGVTFYQEDITKDGFEKIFEKCNFDYVIHHAAQIDVQKSIKNPVLDAEINIVGTIKLLELCKEFNVKKLVYASSAAVYGSPQYLPIDEKHPIKPESFYGISKFTPELYLRTYASLYGIDYAILRYANVYGPRQDASGEGGVVSIFLDRMLQGITPVIYGSGEQTRDFVFVKDVAEANLQALLNGKMITVNVGTGKFVTINELYNIIRITVGWTGEVLYSPQRAGDIKESYLDNRLARSELVWTPQYTLEEGLQITANYVKNLRFRHKTLD